MLPHVQTFVDSFAFVGLLFPFLKNLGTFD